MTLPEIEFSPQNVANDGFELCELESVYKRADRLEFDPFAPHRVNFHHLIYITKGSGSHFIDFNHHPYEVGSIILINRNQVHAFDAENQPEGLMVLFTQEFIDTIRVNIRAPMFAFGFHPATTRRVLNIDRLVTQSVELLFLEMKKITGKEPHDDIVCQLLFATLILKLQRLIPQPFVEKLSEVQAQKFTQFMLLVEDKFSSIKDAAAYAEMIGVTYKTLNQLCKLATRQTPKQLIDAHTVLEAKRRIVIEKIQITQLAHELGFDEVSNFVKYFKKHTLLTPSQFQTNLAG